MEMTTQNLNTKKATGYDNLPADVIKLAALAIITPLAIKLCNISKC